MTALILRGSALYVQGNVTAATLHVLARWARRFGSITINDQELTADTLDDLAWQSECSGEPIRFGAVLDAQPPSMQ